MVNRLRWDPGRFAGPVYDIADIAASEDRFAMRFVHTTTMVQTGDSFRTEVNYLYHLEDSATSEIWSLSDSDYDYKTPP